MRNLRVYWLLFCSVFTLSPAVAQSVGVAYGQLGFLPAGPKELVVRSADSQAVALVDLLRGDTVWRAFPGEARSWDAAGDTVRRIDFSGWVKPGLYGAFQNGKRLGGNLLIDRNAYVPLFQAAAKWFYFQRASEALPYAYAGRFARAAGHADTAVGHWPDTGLVAGKRLSSPGGWYDAGDYGKYIVNSNITVATLMNLAELYPQFVATQKWGIPPRGHLPDLLAEIRYNLDWMLTMQDTDGGVYHKLTTLRFSGPVLPAADTAARFVTAKSTPATLGFAAAMAQAARVYARYDAGFAKRCLQASRKAFAWAKQNPQQMFHQPDGMNTGQYGADAQTTDELLWAASELSVTTAEPSYRAIADSLSTPAQGPWWGNPGYFGVYRIALSPKIFGAARSAAARDSVLVMAGKLRLVADASAYGVPMETSGFVWGSNSVVANNGMILLHAYQLSGDPGYLLAAARALDYLLGKNPLSLCFVTGQGERSPRDPHHRPSEGDMVADPVPGMLVGGPHLGKQDVGPEGWKCKDYTDSQRPALAYLDHRCSYATNEVAINWNAPLVLLVGSLQAAALGERMANSRK